MIFRAFRQLVAVGSSRVPAFACIAPLRSATALPPFLSWVSEDRVISTVKRTRFGLNCRGQRRECGGQLTQCAARRLTFLYLSWIDRLFNFHASLRYIISRNTPVAIEPESPELRSAGVFLFFQNENFIENAEEGKEPHTRAYYFHFWKHMNAYRNHSQPYYILSGVFFMQLDTSSKFAIYLL